MDNRIYRIVFAGEILPNTEKEQVKNNIADLFKVDVSKISHLFSGKRFVLKESTDIEFAKKFAIQFQKRTGAKCIVTKIMPNTDSKKDLDNKKKNIIRKREDDSKISNKISDNFFETRYRLVFKGEVALGSNTDKIITRMNSFYRIEPEFHEDFFSGKRVIVKDNVDFWTAISFLKKFRNVGMTCYPEEIDPPVSPVSSLSKADLDGVSSSNEISGQGSGILDKESIQSAFDKLYMNFTDIYQEVKKKYKIEKEIEKSDNKESIQGCSFIVLLIIIIVLFVETQLKWYMGLLWLVGVLLILFSFEKKWNTEYADFFYWRIRNEKLENIHLFFATFKKWVEYLPEEDNAKEYFLTLVDKNLAEVKDKKKYIKYLRIIQNMKIVYGNAPKKKPKSPLPKEKIRCPSCGYDKIIIEDIKFNWKRGIIATTFLGPLGGAIAANTGLKNGRKICKRCGKKW